ncbi:hypothetical protein V8E55_009891 [Tylopilus felleus]
MDACAVIRNMSYGCAQHRCRVPRCTAIRTRKHPCQDSLLFAWLNEHINQRLCRDALLVSLISPLGLQNTTSRPNSLDLFVHVRLEDAFLDLQTLVSKADAEFHTDSSISRFVPPYRTLTAPNMFTFFRMCREGSSQCWFVFCINPSPN